MATPTEFHFYERMFTMVEGMLSTYVNDTATNIIATIQPTAYTLIAIYIMFWGWVMMRGMIQEPVTDGFTRMIRITVIIAIALNIGYYNGFLSDWLWQTPDELVAQMGADGGASSAQYLDGLMGKSYDFSAAFYEKAKSDSVYGIPDLTHLIMAVFVMLLGLLATIYAAFLIALSKIALAVLLGAGPIFVLSLLFDGTKQFFNLWIGQALNYIFLVLFSAAAVKLILGVLEAYLGAVSGIGGENLGVTHALPAMAFSGIGFLVLMQMPSLASSLGGGVAVGTLGAASAVYGKLKGGASTGKNILTGKTLSDMRSNRRSRRITRQWAKNNPGVSRRTAGFAASRTRQLYQKAMRAREGGEKPNSIEKKR